MKQAIAPGFAQTLREVLERAEAAREIFLEQIAPDHQLEEEMGHLQEEVKHFGRGVVLTVEVLEREASVRASYPWFSIFQRSLPAFCAISRTLPLVVVRLVTHIKCVVCG